jgi:translation initiation factor IF-2
MARQQASKLEGFMDRMQQDAGMRQLNIVIKTDVQGSIEALADVLEKLSNEDVAVKIVGRGVGGLNESDVNLAMASKAIIIGFNVRADSSARKLAEHEGIEIHYFSVIYDVVDTIKAAVTGMIGPKFKEVIVGLAEVRSVFRSSKFGAIAGCMVVDGVIKRNLPIRVLRNDVVIYEGSLESLRRFKEDAASVRSGTECGIGVKNYNDVKEGDKIEVYEKVEVIPQAT